MLPSDLLINRFSGESVDPKRLALEPANLALAQSLIDCFGQAQGKPQGELDQQLAEIEGHSPDFKIQRGLAHLLRQGFCEFEVVSPLDPGELRPLVFAAAAQMAPSPRQTERTLEAIATQLTQTLGQEVLAEAVRQGLYADLPQNRILTQYNPPTAEALIHRYNLSQVQGIFYQATRLVLNAHRNDPGEYKLLFRYLKLFQLMAYIEGEPDQGFTITVDGPTSLFKASTRYGLAIAKLLPALLHVSRWSLRAELQRKDFYTQEKRSARFSLDADCGLVSHYPPGKTYDSMLEESFVQRWEKLKSDWRLEREVDLIPIPGSVMIPDFRLVHPDGRSHLLEIVGYWRPEYLRKKFAQVQKSGRTDLILAISQRLNLDRAGVDFQQLPIPIIWFKDKLPPKAVLAVLEAGDGARSPA
ncbi:MAG: DUF790 family protein [Synechococcales cyanobacterium RM1_1_8]|nr:DUF790 family protein [Synechococcales cyanobacterium RM1_1_8]